MKILFGLTLSLVALSACAANDFKKGLDIEANPIVAQKAQESGISFVSNSDQYQLILGGRAIKEGISLSAMSASQNEQQSNLLWEGANGAFELSISSQNLAQRSAQLSSSGVDYNQIAYNPRTGGIGIVTGQIIVTYTDSFNSTLISESFGIQLSQDFPHLRTAFYSINVWQDIFTITNSLNQSGLVSKAEVEVIENFAVPM